MKRTIDSFFKVIVTDSRKKSKETPSSSLSLQLTKLEQVGNDNLESPNLYSVKSSDKNECRYNVQWEQKYKWLVYKEEKWVRFVNYVKIL